MRHHNTATHGEGVRDVCRKETAVDNPLSIPLTYPLSLPETSVDIRCRAVDISLPISVDLSVDSSVAVDQYSVRPWSKTIKNYSSLLVCISVDSCHDDISMPEWQLDPEMAVWSGMEPAISVSLKDQSSRIRCGSDKKQIISEKPQEARRGTEGDRWHKTSDLVAQPAQRQTDREREDSKTCHRCDRETGRSVGIQADEHRRTQGTGVPRDHQMLYVSIRPLHNMNYRTLEASYILCDGTTGVRGAVTRYGRLQEASERGCQATRETDQAMRIGLHGLWSHSVHPKQSSHLAIDASCCPQGRSIITLPPTQCVCRPYTPIIDMPDFTEKPSVGVGDVLLCGRENAVDKEKKFDAVAVDVDRRCCGGSMGIIDDNRAKGWG